MRGEAHIANVPESIRSQVERDVNERRGVYVPEESRNSASDAERFLRMTKKERESLNAAINVLDLKERFATSMSYSNQKALESLVSDLGVEGWQDVVKAYNDLPAVIQSDIAAKPGHYKERVSTSDVNGETWWTDTRQAYKGNTPKGVTVNLDSHPNIGNVIPAFSDTIPAHQIGVTKLGHVVLESELGRAVVDAKYIAMARKLHGDVSFRLDDRNPGKKPVLVVKGEDRVGVIMPMAMTDEVKNFQLPRRTSADALADAKVVEKPAPQPKEKPAASKPEETKVEPKKSLAERGREARANKSLDETLIRDDQGVTRTLREHSDDLLSRGYEPKMVEQPKYTSKEWNRRIDALKEEKQRIFRNEMRASAEQFHAGKKRSAEIDAIIAGPMPREVVPRAINKEGSRIVLTRAQYDYMVEKLQAPRTSADALADAKAAIQDFKDAPGPKGVKGGKQTGSAMIPISPKQAEALGRAVKHFVEAGHLKLEEVVAQVKQAMGDAWHEGLRPHIEKIFTELTGGGKAKESGNAPKSKETTKTAPAEPPTREAVGPARRFQDTLAEGRGEESAPTNPSAPPKVLADAGLREYNRDKGAVAHRVQDIVNGKSKITRDDIPKITAYMRDVYNEFNKAIANPATPENVLAEMGKTIDDIKLASSYGSGEFHKWGMAMQTAFEPDFSPAELLSTARKISEGYTLDPKYQAALEEAGKKWQDATARIKELESEVERLIAAKDTGKRAPARGTRQRALYNLKSLGFEVTEKVEPVGAKRTKRSGSIDIHHVTPDQYKAIWDFVRSEISENGYQGFDDLMERVNKVLPQVTREMVYGAASGEYRAFDAQRYMAQRKARKTLAAVRASVAYRSMPKARRIGANVMEFLNLPRVLKASTDISAPFIQGRPILMSHPAAWFKSWKPMLEAIKKGPDAVEEQLAKIEQHPLYPILKKGGLDLTEIGGSYHAQEEAYAGHLLPKAYEKGGLIGAGVTPLIHSDSAFAAFMDAARWEVARGLMAMNPHSLAWAHDVAQYTNIISGRGHGKIARMLGSSPLPGMNVFSPRYRLSKWQMAFEPLRVWFSYETTAGKKLALKSWTYRALFMATTAALINATKGKTGVSIDDDPRSSRLGWVTTPDGQQIDLFGTMNDPLRALFSQFYGHVSVKGNYTGPGDFGAPTLTDELTKGSAPVGSMLSIGATGQTYDQRTGENINATPGNVARNLFLPMSLDSIIDRVQNGEEPGKAIPMSIMDMLGFNSNPLRNQTPKRKPAPLDLRVLPGWNRKPKEGGTDKATQDWLRRLSALGGK